MEFRILGPLEVAVGGRLLELGRPKQRAVLAILLVHANRTVSLEHLVDELWGEESPAQAVASLQAYVSHLRRLLEPGRGARAPAQVLVSQSPGYRVVVSTGDLDATRFEALADEGRRLLQAGRADQADDTLGQALALWRGEVLADFPDAGFTRAHRARLDELRLGACEDRFAAGLALGRQVGVLAELDRLIGENPYRENLHGLRMLALYRDGRQAEALDAYRRTRRMLGEDLGLEPGPQLRALHRQILDHAPELDRPTAGRAAPMTGEHPGGADEAPDPRTTLVGRADEVSCLRRMLATTVAGHGRLVLVTGEPGVGKTRITEELGRRAAGVAVAWGHCPEEPGAPPFWPWAQVLRGLLGDLPADRQQAVLAPNRADLGALVPESTGPPPAGPPVVDVEAVRFRVCRAVVAVLRRLAAGRPLLILIDDVHWADAGSLRLLPVLAAELASARILVVVTYREPGEAMPADTMAALARLATVDRLPLRGLTEGDVRRLMAVRLGAVPDEQLVQVVHDRSAGNPFFVLELVRLLGSERRLAAAQEAAASEVPAGVRDVLRRRLAGLPEQTQAILLVAAVVGREFDLGVLRDAAGLPDEAVLDAVEAALLSGLVTEEPAVGRFRFTHALVREAIYRQVSRARRAWLHARVAQALDGRPGSADRAGEHWGFAAPVVGARTALPHLVAAADEALATLAHERAEQHLVHARDLLAAEPPSTGRTRCELDVQMRLGTLSAQLYGAQSASGRAAVTRARELAEQLADGPATIAAYRSLYEVAVARAEHTHARELAERMLDVSRGMDDGVAAQAHLAIGRTLWCLGQPVAARDNLRRSLDLAAAAPDRPHELLPVDITARLQLAPVLDLLGHPAEAVDHVDTAIAGTRGMAHPVRAGVLTSAALIGALRRDVAVAGAHARQALELAGPLPAWFSYASAVRSWTRAMQGDPAAGARALRADLDAIQSRGARHLVPWVLGLLAEAESLSGHLAEALRLLEQALTLVARTGERLHEAELHRLRGRVLLVAAPHRTDDARAALWVAYDTARRQGAVLVSRRAAEDLRLAGEPA